MKLLYKIKSIWNSELIRSSVYSAGATLIKLVTAFLMSKVVAIYLGPGGLGLIGQLSNFMTIVLVLAGGAINHGIVKYVAQFRMHDADLLPTLISTGFKTAVVLGLLSSIGLILFSSWIAKYVLFDRKYAIIFVIFGFTVTFYSLNTFLLSIVNGHKEFKKFNFISSITSIIGLIVSFILIKFIGVTGALIAVVSNQSIIFFFTLGLLHKEPWMKLANFTSAFNKEIAWKLSSFIVMTVVSTACVPSTQMFIRSVVIQKLSLQQAGIWEAINRISGLYLLFITTSLSTYYLPRLSEISESGELRIEIIRAFKIILPIVIFLSLMIFLFRNLIINVLFTKEFSSAQELFFFQLVGDFFKIAAWLLAFQMVAKAMTVHFIVTEIIFSLTYAVLCLWLMKLFGLQGLTLAYGVNYIIYFITMVFLFRKIIFKNGR